MYQEYNPESGQIIGTSAMDAKTANDAIEQCEAHLCEGDGDWRTHYVDISTSPPVVREKQQQQTRLDKTELQADGEDFITLSNLPVPCKVTIAGEQYEVDDGVFEWGTLRRGKYQIAVEAVPFLNWNAEVCAV